MRGYLDRIYAGALSFRFESDATVRHKKNLELCGPVSVTMHDTSNIDPTMV